MLNCAFEFQNSRHLEFHDEEDFLRQDREERKQLAFDEIFESSTKLLTPSKKIAKKSSLSTEVSDKRNKKKITQSKVSRQNAQKLAPFFKKWKELRKKDKIFKKQLKYWFSSFDQKVNKTYIYRDFSDIRIHFRLVLRDGFAFGEMGNSEWKAMFINLTEFLTEEAQKMKEGTDKGKKSQVYPVWIEEVNKFSVGQLSTHSDTV